MKLLANNIICGRQVEVKYLDTYDDGKVEVEYQGHNFIVNTYDIIIEQ